MNTKMHACNGTGQQPAQPSSGEALRVTNPGYAAFLDSTAGKTITAQRAQIGRLQSALAATKAYADDVEVRYHTAHERLTAAQQRIAALHAALRTYGWHKPECDYMQEELPCTCGFMDAIKEPS